MSASLTSSPSPHLPPTSPTPSDAYSKSARSSSSIGKAMLPSQVRPVPLPLPHHHPVSSPCLRHRFTIAPGPSLARFHAVLTSLPPPSRHCRLVQRRLTEPPALHTRDRPN